MTTKPNVAAAPSAAWRNRIVGHGDEPPEQLLANPANWRLHPKDQQRALAGALSEVGWVAQVLVNRTTGHVVDGHLRVELAISRHEPTVPVAYVELSERSSSQRSLGGGRPMASRSGHGSRLSSPGSPTTPG